ncbi:MAG: heme-binding protein [Betaproteobacteria bacterium]
MTLPIFKSLLAAPTWCFALLWGLSQVPQSFASTDGTFAVKLLTPEAAATAAQAAMAHCRKAGYQVSVAIVDRFGVLQFMVRDRYAGPHTAEFATQKAWTAASFKMSTAALAAETQAGKPMNGMRANPHVLAIGGGQVIEAAGSLLGGIGVSGAPGGDADEACALAGLRAIADAIEF